ncbi:MAG: DUF4091 domain-containing protein [Acidobacteriota bacterium]
MKSAMTTLATIAALLGVSMSTGCQRSTTLETWWVDSLVKIFPDTRPERTQGEPQLVAVRNQHVSLQLAVRSSLAVRNLTANLAPLTSSNGDRIESASVRPVGYVPVAWHTTDTPAEERVGEAPGWFPDPLLDFPLDLPPQQTHSLWISIRVPEKATGLYRGTLEITSGTQSLARQDFLLTVRAATVPHDRSLKVTNWFSLGETISRQFYGLQVYSEEWWQLVENVAQVLAQHRQNVILTPVLDLVEVRLQGGQLRYDFARFDRWVETFRRAGAIGYLEGTHLLGRTGGYETPLAVGLYALSRHGKPERLSLPPDDPRVGTFLSSFLPALNQHLEEKGWKEIYLQHILDEPHGAEPPYYGRIAEYVRRHLPGVRTIDAVDAAHLPQEVQKYCDIWVPLLGRFDDKLQGLQERVQSGREVWFYTCLFPTGKYPNRLIDYPLLKVQLLHWLNFRHGLAGFLHWGGNHWTPDPMKATQPIINENTTLLPAGDAFIVYPDRPNKSIRSSIRLEIMREGIEDYELLKLLSCRRPERAAELARQAIPELTDYVRTPTAFRKIQSDLIDQLDGL